jgi:hypothetical protein
VGTFQCRGAAGSSEQSAPGEARAACCAQSVAPRAPHPRTLHSCRRHSCTGVSLHRPMCACILLPEPGTVAWSPHLPPGTRTSHMVPAAPKDATHTPLASSLHQWEAARRSPRAHLPPGQDTRPLTHLVSVVGVQLGALLHDLHDPVRQHVGALVVGQLQGTCQQPVPRWHTARSALRCRAAHATMQGRRRAGR